MSSEILNTIPPSGQYPEKHFGVNFNSSLCVKFTDNEFHEWVGLFSKSNDNALNKVLIDESNSIGIIIAGGHGYLIDLIKREIIVDLDEQPLVESVIRTTNPDYFVAGTFYCIYILNNNGLFKEITPDYIVDGIYFKGQIDGLATGDLATAENQYDYKVDFEFDLMTFNLTLKDKPKVRLIERLLNLFKKDRDVSH